MTLYFRPDNAKYAPINLEIKEERNLFHFTLGIYRKTMQTLQHELQYNIDPQTKKFKNRNQFAGLSVKTQHYVFKLKSSIKKGQIIAQTQFNAKQMFDNYKKQQADRNTIFESVIKIGDYKILSSFKIDCLREINGRSEFTKMKIKENSQFDKRIKKVSSQEQSTGYKQQPQQQLRDLQKSQINMIELKQSLISAPTPRYQEKYEENHVTNSAQKEDKNEQNIVYYKGPCKNTNIFSCLDQQFPKSQFHAIEEPFI